MSGACLPLISLPNGRVDGRKDSARIFHLGSFFSSSTFSFSTGGGVRILTASLLYT